MKDCKIIQFKNKKAEVEEELRIKRIKDNAHLLIDLSEGDFVLIFKTEDIKHNFDGILDKDFVVAMSDIEKRNPNNPEYFFNNFGYSRLYFDLNK